MGGLPWDLYIGASSLRMDFHLRLKDWIVVGMFSGTKICAFLFGYFFFRDFFVATICLISEKIQERKRYRGRRKIWFLSLAYKSARFCILLSLWASIGDFVFENISLVNVVLLYFIIIIIVIIIIYGEVGCFGNYNGDRNALFLVWKLWNFFFFACLLLGMGF